MPDSTPESPFPEFSTGELIDLDSVRSQFSSLGKKVKLYRGCRINPTERVSIGDFSQIDEGVLIFAGLGVEIGEHVHLASTAHIFGGGFCMIEDFAGVSSGVKIVTGSEDPHGTKLTNSTIPDEWRSAKRSKVVVGKHALIFTGAIIHPGVSIGDGAVVSSGAIVHKDLNPWTIYAGNPLVPVGMRDRDAIIESEKNFKESKSSQK